MYILISFYSAVKVIGLAKGKLARTSSSDDDFVYLEDVEKTRL